MRQPTKRTRAIRNRVETIHRQLDIPIAITIAKMADRGLCIDIDELIRLEQDHIKKMRIALQDCKNVGIWANPSSPKQMMQNFIELGLDTGRWGKQNEKGERIMSTGRDALLDLVEQNSYAHMYAEPLLRYRKSKKFKGQYIKGMARSTFKDPHINRHIIKGNFLWPGTNTWRPSCKKPNLLNLPRTGFRTCIVSRYDKGHIIKADYGQLELRVLASLSKDPVMLKIYMDGLDIHGTTATQFYGPRYTKDERSRAKGVNFGVVYGASARRIRDELRKDDVVMTLEEAEEWLAVWRKTYKVAWSYMMNLQRAAMKFWRVKAPSYDVVRRFDLAAGKRMDEIAREGANMPIQAGAALMTARAAEKFENKSENILYEKGILVNLIYDELVVDAPDDGHWAAKTMVSAMLEAAEEEPWFIVPAEVDAEIGPSWGNTKKV